MSNNLLLKIANDLCSFCHLGNYLGKFLKKYCSRLLPCQCHVQCLFPNHAQTYTLAMLTSGPMSIAYSRTNMYPCHVNVMLNLYFLLMHKDVPLPCQCHVQCPLPTQAQIRTLAMSTPCLMSIAYSRFYAPA